MALSMFDDYVSYVMLSPIITPLMPRALCARAVAAFCRCAEDARRLLIDAVI